MPSAHFYFRMTSFVRLCIPTSSYIFFRMEYAAMFAKAVTKISRPDMVIVR